MTLTFLTLVAVTASATAAAAAAEEMPEWAMMEPLAAPGPDGIECGFRSVALLTDQNQNRRGAVACCFAVHFRPNSAWAW